MIRLLFVDDQPVMLRFLEHCFNDTGCYEIVGSLTQASVADLWCIEKKPDAIFLDIQTKEQNTNGLKMAQAIRKKCPQVRILMMTGFDEVSYLPRAKELGVDAFLFKSEPANRYVEALHTVLDGKGSLFPEEEKRIPVVPGENPLTQREMEVLRLICSDQSNKEIAAALDIKECTVKRHIESLLRKTERSGRAGLVAYAIAGGWINPNN